MQQIIRIIGLMAFQILILNQVYLGGVAVPFLYILIILMLPVGMNKIGLLLTAFAVGFCMDLFCNMLGFHTFSCVLIAFARILFADRILTRGEAVEIPTPSLYAVKPQYFIAYMLTLTFVFFLTYFLIELFDKRSLWLMFLSTVVSTLVTGVLILIYQLLFVKKKTS